MHCHFAYTDEVGRCILIRRSMQKLVLILIAFIAMVTFIRAFDKEAAADVVGSSVTVSESRAEEQ